MSNHLTILLAYLQFLNKMLLFKKWKSLLTMYRDAQTMKKRKIKRAKIFSLLKPFSFCLNLAELLKLVNKMDQKNQNAKYAFRYTRNLGKFSNNKFSCELIIWVFVKTKLLLYAKYVFLGWNMSQNWHQPIFFFIFPGGFHSFYCKGPHRFFFWLFSGHIIT